MGNSFIYNKLHFFLSITKKKYLTFKNVIFFINSYRLIFYFFLIKVSTYIWD